MRRPHAMPLGAQMLDAGVELAQPAALSTMVLKGARP